MTLQELKAKEDLIEASKLELKKNEEEKEEDDKYRDKVEFVLNKTTKTKKESKKTMKVYLETLIKWRRDQITHGIMEEDKDFPSTTETRD